MGAYLNKPVVEKVSEEGQNEAFRFACTSMQGWRLNQEDAHNCVMNIKNNWNMFAVYDGHGGSEVAEYTSQSFPDFLKEKNIWEVENCEAAIQDAFIAFDDHLRSKPILRKLAMLSDNGKVENGNDSEDEMDRIETIEESTLPLEELLRRYGYKQIEKELQANKKSILAAFEAVHQEENGDSSKSKNGKDPEDPDGDKKPFKRSSKSPLEGSPKKVKTTEDENSASDEHEDDAKESDSSKKEEDAENKPEPKKIVFIQKKRSAFDAPKVEKPAGEGDADESDDEDFNEDEEEAVDDEEDSGDEMPEDGLSFATAGSSVAGEDSGTTACVCFMNAEKLVVANVGDSRAVLCRAGKAVDLSVDHKPEDEIEKTRILKAGGFIQDGRVNSGLNLSRALGDHCYKKNEELPLREQMISALPDVKIEKLTPEDEFLVVACDGIWNSLESQEVVDFIKENLKEGKTCKEICDALCDKCLAESTAGDGTGCDNMTVIITEIVH